MKLSPEYLADQFGLGAQEAVQLYFAWETFMRDYQSDEAITRFFVAMADHLELTLKIQTGDDNTRYWRLMLNEEKAITCEKESQWGGIRYYLEELCEEQ